MDRQSTHTILISQVLHEDQLCDVLIRGRYIESITPSREPQKSTERPVSPERPQADTLIDGRGFAVLPTFFNTHTHAAMTLLRGYADDLALHEWLNDRIWPREAELTSEDIYWGTRYCVLEMIKSGTSFLSDMYFHTDTIARAIQQMHIRATVGVAVMNSVSPEQIEEGFELIKGWHDPEGLVDLSVAPHSIYTVDERMLLRCADIATTYHKKLHIHLSETVQEVEECRAQHGTTPVRYLERLGVLGPNVIAAHCVHLDEQEWEILARHGVSVAHCPASNMKLGSGRLDYATALKSGTRMTLATDGAASNNNVDMREEMKLASFYAKSAGDPTLLSADEILRWATRNGAEAYGINAGSIEEGRLADLILVDTNNIKMQPLHSLTSNWVYAADSSCIDTLICDGRIIMRQRRVEGEQELLDKIKFQTNNKQTRS